jgi:hypothetical protein
VTAAVPPPRGPQPRRQRVTRRRAGLPRPDLSYAVHWLAPPAGIPACHSKRCHYGTGQAADVTCGTCKLTRAWRAAIAPARPPSPAALNQLAADLEAKAQATADLADQSREFCREDLCAALAQLAGELRATAESFRRLARARTAGRGHPAQAR